VADTISLPLETITVVHKKTHESKYFSGGHQSASVANNASVDILLHVGTIPIHTIFLATTDGAALGYLYEGVTYSSSGSALTVSNHNRENPVASTATAYHTPTVSATGAQIDGIAQIAGGAGPHAIGGSSSHLTGEIILARNTDYLLRITNISGSSQRMTSHFEFYEPD